MSRALSSITSGKADLGVANGAGMPALGLSAAAVLVNGLVVRCDPRLPSHPKGVKWGKNRSIADMLAGSSALFCPCLHLQNKTWNRGLTPRTQYPPGFVNPRFPPRSPFENGKIPAKNAHCGERWVKGPNISHVDKKFKPLLSWTPTKVLLSRTF